MNIIDLFSSKYVTKVERDDQGIMEVTMTNPATGYEYVYCDVSGCSVSLNQWVKFTTQTIEEIIAASSPEEAPTVTTGSYAHRDNIGYWLSKIADELAELNTAVSALADPPSFYRKGGRGMYNP